MQSSPPGGPACCWLGGAPKAPPPETGGAPAAGKPPVGAPIEAAGAPFTGGNGDALLCDALLCDVLLWFGSGAGKAPCAKAEAVETAKTASVKGKLERRIVKIAPPAKVDALDSEIAKGDAASKQCGS